MLDTNDILDKNVEKFSLNRKSALQTLVQLKAIEGEQLKWMIKNVKGPLKRGLQRYKKSQKSNEDICHLLTTLAIDASELDEVETEIIKTMSKAEKLLK